ncbi:MAG: Na(+)/H(+) antiporter subunit B [Solirubrobacteraceae bacterium]
MNVLQGAALVLVALGGTAVVACRDPLRQAIVTGIFGLLLAILFFAFQAPDVALSEIVIGTIGVPVMILLALAKLREATRRQQEREQ